MKTTFIILLLFSLRSYAFRVENENDNWKVRRELFPSELSISSLREVDCEHSTPPPSCRSGMCRFYNCDKAPSCRGGGCYFENCVDASCDGGGCLFRLCERPTCKGGGCDFTDNRDILNKGFCDGGGCTYDGFPISSDSSAAV